MSADELKQAALEGLAEQAIVSAPREIFKLFPNWEAELAPATAALNGK